MLKMQNDRLTKKVFMWDKMLNNSGTVNTWYNEVKEILNNCNFQYIYETGAIFPLRPTILSITDTLKSRQNNDLKIECLAMPKLRTFNLFNDFETQPSFLY